jgi:hypothetical protein
MTPPVVLKISPVGWIWEENEQVRFRAGNGR